MGGSRGADWFGCCWFQVAPTMSLQVIGLAGKGAKVVLWAESRVPRQTWRIDSFGRICSQMFEDMILDVKGEAWACSPSEFGGEGGQFLRSSIPLRKSLGFGCGRDSPAHWGWIISVL